MQKQAQEKARAGMYLYIPFWSRFFEATNFCAKTARQNKRERPEELIQLGVLIYDGGGNF
jgi:hypothetical protein